MLEELFKCQCLINTMVNDDEKKIKIVRDEIDFNDLIDYTTEDDDLSSVIQNASLAGVATQAGIQVKSLQFAIDNYANAMNQAAIAKSTGLPVVTPTQQYKGFAAEEYFIHTL